MDNERKEQPLLVVIEVHTSAVLLWEIHTEVDNRNSVKWKLEYSQWANIYCTLC